MILIIMELSFVYDKKILVRLKQKATFVLMCFVIKQAVFSNLHFRSKI